jgi:hypothetical protein
MPNAGEPMANESYFHEYLSGTRFEYLFYVKYQKLKS